MDEKKLADELREEGFLHTYVWQDRPGTFYPGHVHDEETAHIILSGEIFWKWTVKVPAGAVHSARMGPHGCRYLIGER